MSSRGHSLQAFHFTMGRLFERGNCYMWTFTLPVALDVSVARRMWSRLSASLVKELGVVGVRVFELHPNGHGLHIHAVLLGRYNVRAVRHLSRCQGFGRIHVSKRLTSVDGCLYLAKYLSKQDRPPCFSGVRLWASLGKAEGYRHCAVRNVSLHSLKSRSISYARKYLGLSGVKLLQASELVIFKAIEAGDDLSGCCASLQIAMSKEWAILPRARNYNRVKESFDGLQKSDYLRCTFMPATDDRPMPRAGAGRGLSSVAA